MPKLKIHTYPHPTLRQVAQPVAPEKITTAGFQQFLRALMTKLEDKFPLGAGLAATQVGEPQRVFVVNMQVDHDNFMKQFFINPVIVRQSTHLELDWEGCLSLPDQWGQVKRPRSVTVRAINGAGEMFEVNAAHFYARLLQHELDHLDGVLFIDKLESAVINTNQLDQIIRTEEHEPLHQEHIG